MRHTLRASSTIVIVPVRVLIVDDEPAIVDSLTLILQRHGYEVTGVTTFDEARRLLRATPPPDLLLTDVRLGSYNGLQLVVLRNAMTAAIIMSGYWDTTIADEGRQHGAIYLLKPVPHAQLLDTIERALAARPSPGEPTPGTAPV